MKTTVLSLIGIALILWITSCNNDTKKENNNLPKESKFIWKGDSLGNFYYAQSSILIPADIEQDKSNNNSYFILNSSISDKYLFRDYAKKIGEIKSGKNDFDDDFIEGISGSLNNIRFESYTFNVYNRYEDLNDSIIGQISLDFFNQNEIKIDFKENKLIVADKFEVPENHIFNDYELYLNRKIIIPIYAQDKKYDFLLNPQSALYVIFNKEISGKIEIGNIKYEAPQFRSVKNANPDFNGILGYAFLKDKSVIFRPDKKQVCIY